MDSNQTTTKCRAIPCWSLSFAELFLLFLLLLLIIFILGKYDPEGDEKLRKLIYKLEYDHQSVRSWTANCCAEGQHCTAVSTPRPSDTGSWSLWSHPS